MAFPYPLLTAWVTALTAFAAVPITSLAMLVMNAILKAALGGRVGEVGSSGLSRK